MSIGGPELLIILAIVIQLARKAGESIREVKGEANSIKGVGKELKDQVKGARAELAGKSYDEDKA
jgi:Sec-independent protein translocase protein TatA